MPGGMKLWGFHTGSEVQPKQSMKVLAIAEIAFSFFLLAWLLTGTAFLHKHFQDETFFPLFFILSFLNPISEGYVYTKTGAQFCPELILILEAILIQLTLRPVERGGFCVL